MSYYTQHAYMNNPILIYKVLKEENFVHGYCEFDLTGYIDLANDEKG